MVADVAFGEYPDQAAILHHRQAPKAARIHHGLCPRQGIARRHGDRIVGHAVRYLHACSSHELNFGPGNKCKPLAIDQRIAALANPLHCKKSGGNVPQCEGYNWHHAASRVTPFDTVSSDLTALSVLCLGIANAQGPEALVARG